MTAIGGRDSRNGKALRQGSSIRRYAAAYVDAAYYAAAGADYVAAGADYVAGAVDAAVNGAALH